MSEGVTTYPNGWNARFAKAAGSDTKALTGYPEVPGGGLRV